MKSYYTGIIFSSLILNLLTSILSFTFGLLYFFIINIYNTCLLNLSIWMLIYGTFNFMLTVLLVVKKNIYFITNTLFIFILLFGWSIYGFIMYIVIISNPELKIDINYIMVDNNNSLYCYDKDQIFTIIFFCSSVYSLLFCTSFIVISLKIIYAFYNGFVVPFIQD